MLRKLSCVIIILCMVGGLMVACTQQPTTTQGGSTTTTQGQGGTTTTTTAAGKWTYQMGGPVSEEPVTIKILTHTGWATTMMPANSNLPIYAAIEERLGINIEWQTIEATTYGEMLNVRLMSSDLPDMVVMTDLNITAQMVQDDFFWAYDDLEYESNGPYSQILLSDPAYSNFETVYRSLFGDGKIYGFGNTVIQRFLGLNMLVNTMWLDQVGLEEPSTVDEFLDMLRTFKNEDANNDGNPKNEIPLVEQGGMNNFLGNAYSLHMYYGWNLNDEGKVEHEYVKQQYFDYLQTRRVMFDEGLIDKENRDMNSVYELVAQNVLGSVGYWATFQNIIDSKSQYYEGPSVSIFRELFPLVNVYTNVRQRYSRPTTGVGEGMYIVKKGNHPEVCLRVADWLWGSEEFKMLFNYGIEGLSFEYNAEGIPVPIKPDAFEGDASQYLTSIGGNQPPFAHMQWEYAWAQKRIAQGMTQIVERANAIKEFYIDAMPPLVFNAEETQEINKYMTDINTYRAEETANFIEGRKDLTQANYDAYVAQLYKIGLDKVTEIYQAKYDEVFGG